MFSDILSPKKDINHTIEPKLEDQLLQNIKNVVTECFMSIDRSANNIVLITGAGSGVGRATGLTLLEAGYQVILSGRHKNSLEETRNMSEENHDRARVIEADISDKRSVENLFEAIEKKYGRLDVLFNNAGIGAPNASIEDLDFAEWEKVVNTNLSGTFLCTQAAFRLMKAQKPQGGRIINNGSISADRPRPNSAPYTSTKHGITGLTKSTSLDGRKYNIACGQIDIGNAATEMTEPMRSGIAQSDGTIKIEPTMNVSAVSEAVLYMANLPLTANVQFMTVMATSMPYIGRG
jgi:NAD(P)-dependent dehydrogenase (short-subunit alcohol dehydrogenase family)